MTVCVWCSRKLGTNHGFSDKGEPICCSYSNPPTRAYNSCKSRKNRLVSKKSSQPEAAQASLGDGIQIMINQLEELIALQKQALSQTRTVVKETTSKVIETTKEFTEPNFDDMDFDVEIKKTEDVSSADRFRKQMMAMANKEGVWADKPKDVKQ